MKKRPLSMLLVIALSAILITPVSAASPADALSGISYYGNLSNCKMTAQQAEAFAAVIRSEEAAYKQKCETDMKKYGYFKHSFDSQVAFADPGNGVPVMLFFSAMKNDERYGAADYGGYNSLWQWNNGKVTRFIPPTNWMKKNSSYPEGLYCHLYSDHILVFDANYEMTGQVMNLAVFPFQNGQIARFPSTSAYYYSYGYQEKTFQINGKTATESQIKAWMQKNGNGDHIAFGEGAGSLAGYNYIRQGAYDVWGMTSAGKVLTALDSYARSAMVAGFKDVIAGDWFANDVKYVSQKGLMTGTGNDLFSPNGTTTRGQAVTILYRLAGSPSASGNSFSDVSSSDWFYKAVQWASKNNIVSGYGDGRFGPNDTLNREQLAAMLYRYAQFKKLDTTGTGGLSKFSDSDSISGYALDAMSWAVGKGLISGTSDGRLAPNATATRAQLAAIIHRFNENVKR